MHLCTISVDRYLSLRYPMKFGRNKTRRRVMLKISFVWVLSIAMSLPLSLMYSKVRQLIRNNRHIWDCIMNRKCGESSWNFVRVRINSGAISGETKHRISIRVSSAIIGRDRLESTRWALWSWADHCRVEPKLDRWKYPEFRTRLESVFRISANQSTPSFFSRRDLKISITRYFEAERSYLEHVRVSLENVKYLC